MTAHSRHTKRLTPNTCATAPDANEGADQAELHQHRLRLQTLQQGVS